MSGAKTRDGRDGEKAGRERREARGQERTRKEEGRRRARRRPVLPSPRIALRPLLDPSPDNIDELR